MAGLDKRLILMSDLQSLFRDKDTGLPLAAGIITFYKDQSRTTKKPVYQLTGTPGNYSFSALPNPMILSGAGTFQYLGNDIDVYYFPYEETPDEESTTVELYYITVQNSGEVAQFTRQAWPNTIGSSTAAGNIVNYIPNGQFLIHTDLPETDTKEAGEIRAAVTVLAQGGFYFVRPETSTAKDIVTFERINEFVENPTQSPRYKMRVVNETVGANNAYKDFRIRFNDVNKFASDDAQYTFSLCGESMSAGTVPVTIFVVKNYGSGGDAQEESSKGLLNIGNSFDQHQVLFTFGSNAGKVIGPNNDDYVEIAVRYPTSFTFDIALSDIVLTDGDVRVTSFPVTPNADFVIDAISGGADVPNYAGMDLYLPLILTPTGISYDDGLVGKPFLSLEETIPDGFLAMDGSTYEYAAYSNLGIPYRRLGDKWWKADILNYVGGTGLLYATAIYNASPINNEIVLSTNRYGVVTNAVDVDSGFTFSNICTGQGGVYPMTGYYFTNALIIENHYVGSSDDTVTEPDNHNSGFTHSILRKSNLDIPQIVKINTIAASGMTPGNYFIFHVPGATYNIWYRIDGAGSSPGGSNIRVDILSTDSAQAVANKTLMAINAYTATQINCLAASAITSGQYWNFNTNQTPGEYYVWYKKDGVGTDPAPGSRIGIQVDITTGQTSTQVATATITAINRKFFCVPNAAGFYPKIADPTNIWDNAPRYSLINGLLRNAGSMQPDNIFFHNHTDGDSYLVNLGTTQNVLKITGTANSTGFYIGAEQNDTRNMAFNLIVKY